MKRIGIVDFDLLKKEYQEYKERLNQDNLTKEEKEYYKGNINGIELTLEIIFGKEYIDFLK